MRKSLVVPSIIALILAWSASALFTPGQSSNAPLQDLDFGDEETFVLVGAGEEDYDAGKINVASPLAQGLMGSKVGQKVEIDVPAGTMKFEILKVRFDD